jgi:hypothetical protein
VDFSTENLFKIRDALTDIQAAIQAELDNRNPELTPQKPANYNPENIDWFKASGPNGKYERYPAPQQQPKITPDYTYLMDQLKKHDGKFSYGGLFYWLFNDNVTIGRKPSKR